jgi:nucleotide-binding universal stress UspA family protein
MERKILKTKSSMPLVRRVTQKISGPLIWAVDPVDFDEVQIKQMQRMQNVWSQDHQEIIMTSVFSPLELGFTIKSRHLKRREIFNNARDEIKNRILPIEPSSHFKPMLSSANSLHDRVVTLLNFAKRKKSEVIMVGSQARSRSRLTGLGSFTEALISLSTRPVLVVGQNVEEIKSISKIFFPTDFSDTSKIAFKNTLKFASKFKAEVILYHHMDLSGPMAFGLPWGFDINWIDEYWQAHGEYVEKEGQIWSEEAKQVGVQCHAIIDRKMNSLNDSMMKRIEEEKADLLSLAVKRGPWSQIILGRFVRTLFADSKIPILVLHARAEQRKAKLH